MVSLSLPQARNNRELFSPRSIEENTIKLFYLTKRSKRGAEDLIQYIGTSLHTRHNMKFLLLLLRKGSSLHVQHVLWWIFVQGQSWLQQLLLYSFIPPLQCPSLWGYKGTSGMAVQWTAAGNCSGWKLACWKDFLVGLFCCCIFLPDPWAIVHCTGTQTALLAWQQRWCREECFVSTSVSSCSSCASQAASNTRIKGLLMKSSIVLLFYSAEHLVPIYLVYSH